jgi:hypothetical protein
VLQSAANQKITHAGGGGMGKIKEQRDGVMHDDGRTEDADRITGGGTLRV